MPAFEQILYWITFSRDDFDLPKFLDALPFSPDQVDEGAASVAPRDPSVGSYHATMRWRVTADEVRFQFVYHAGPLPHAGEEHEPYAENLMQWLGQFYGSEATTGHAHARLRFSTGARAATFPLSLKAEVPYDGELYGVALRLRSRPQGVSSVRLTRGRSDWYAEVVGERPIVFKDFDPVSDVTEYQVVLNSFLKEVER